MCDTGGALAGGVGFSGRLLTGGHRSVEGKVRFDILQMEDVSVFALI